MPRALKPPNEAMEAMSWDNDGFWLERVRRTKSNSAVNGWLDLVDYIKSGRADTLTLSGLTVALRSLSQECQRQLSERREAERLKRYAR